MATRHYDGFPASPGQGQVTGACACDDVAELCGARGLLLGNLL
jgi:hypothetical protein